METVQKNERRRGKPRRWLWLVAVWVLLMLLVRARAIVLDTEKEPLPERQDTTVLLWQRDTADVVSITVDRDGSDPWTAQQLTPGLLTVTGEDGFEMTAADSQDLLDAVAHLTAVSRLTDDAADYRNALADFGLDEPESVVITFANGTEKALRIGDASADGSWYYLLIDGDDSLYTLSRGEVECLLPNRDTLRLVTQPDVHKARIDHIAFIGPEGVQAAWALQKPITAPDAIDHWAVTAPVTYPADSTAMGNLLTNVANLRLGAYVCEATPETLTAYGFDTPRLTIEIHMAAGTVGTVNAEGAYITADWPESTTTYVVGDAKTDLIDYVLHDGVIYISSHFTVGLFIDYDVTPTLSRYLVPVALGNLSRLTIEKSGTAEDYVITRTEQVAANNELVTDVDGSILYDITATKNGASLDYAAFEAAYSALLPLTVSGTLPEKVDAAPHTIYTFYDVDGTVYTVAFATFDALHDAVSIDGHQAFYLIKGGFDLGL